ncbi:hypothetical protein ACLOJK_013509 [Asimina triloba]
MTKSRTIVFSSLLPLLLLFQSVAAQSGNETNTDNPYGFSTKINPAMAVIIVVLIAAFFFMGFFSIYIRRCSQSDQTAAGRLINGARGGRSRRVGLDPSVIQTFPILEYSVVKGLKIGKGALECAVCLNEFDDDETLRLLPKCDHVFHPDCIDAWLATHTTCPVCRANLAPGSEPAPPVAEATVAAETLDAAANGSSNRGEPESVGHVAIDVPDDRDEEPPQPEVIKATPSMKNRPVRSGSSRRPMRFPRSHSTGHSLVLVQPGENVDRYTLRLPEHVRKEILQRTTSCVAFPVVGDGSSRGGRSYRGKGGEGSSRGRNFPFGRLEWAAKSDRWTFSVTPPFFSRSLSVLSPKVADGEVTPGKRNPSGSFKSPFDCLAKPVTDEEGQARSSTPVFAASSSQQQP